MTEELVREKGKKQIIIQIKYIFWLQRCGGEDWEWWGRLALALLLFTLIYICARAVE